MKLECADDDSPLMQSTRNEDAESLRFIEAVKARPSIWDRNMRCYKNAILKEQLFAEIEVELGWVNKHGPVENAGKRAKVHWAKILGQFRRIRRSPLEMAASNILSPECVSALDFYTNMLDSYNKWVDYRATRRENRNGHPSSFDDDFDPKESIPSSLAGLLQSTEPSHDTNSVEDFVMEDPSAFLQRVVKMYPDDSYHDELGISSYDSKPELVVAKEESVDDDDDATTNRLIDGDDHHPMKTSSLTPEVTSSSDQLVATNLSTIMEQAMWTEPENDDEDEADVLRFIKAIREREGIWRRSSSLYRMPHMKMAWFAEVEHECNMTVTGGHNARQRWQRLIAAYRTYVSEMIQGRGQINFITPSARTFKYYEAMRFYEESYKASIARRELLAAQRHADIMTATSAMAPNSGMINQMLEAVVAMSQHQQQQQALHSLPSIPSSSSSISHLNPPTTSTSTVTLPSSSSTTATTVHSSSSSSQLLQVPPISSTTSTVGGPSTSGAAEPKKRRLDHPPPPPAPPSCTSTLLPSSQPPVTTIRSSPSPSSTSSLSSSSMMMPPIAAAPVTVFSGTLPTTATVAAPHSVMMLPPIASPLHHAKVAPSHSELYALIDHVMEGMGLIQATQAKGEIISFLVQLKEKYAEK